MTHSELSAGHESSSNLKRKRISTNHENLENASTDRAPKRPNLSIQIPDGKSDVHSSITEASKRSSLDSLFSCVSEKDSLFDEATHIELSDSPAGISPMPDYRSAAWRTLPPIPGLYFNPSVQLPDELADVVAQYCLQTYFSSPEINQVMLFGRAPPSLDYLKASVIPSPAHGHAGIPPPLIDLLSSLSELLQPILPLDVHELIFPRIPTRARQAILNLYQPGEGITAHVDLLRRFGDGIVGVSLLGGCVMQFVKQRACIESQVPASESSSLVGTESPHDAQDDARSTYDVYLPPRSALVMSGDARFNWTHGIDKRKRDFVMESDGDEKNAKWIERSVRLSITFRWLLPGADVVGSTADE